MKTILVTCKNPDCNRQFRVPEYSRPDSTIKNNPDKQECIICKNRKILQEASFYGKNKTSLSKRAFSSTKNKEGLNRLKKADKKKSKRLPWTEKDLPDLIRFVQDKFCNKYIRERDKAVFGNHCISCRNGKIQNAGHRYNVGGFNSMRLMIINIHGQCISCNHDKSGNIDAYDRGLKRRFGNQFVVDLGKEADMSLASSSFKFYRFDVIEIGKTYNYLLRNKIWIFTQGEFDKYREFVNRRI